jgi:hypothetical protein
MTEDLRNLAKHVKARRLHKDWTQLDVYNQGGPSNSTLTQVEDARTPGPSRSTIRKLDVGLQWESGSTRRVLEGGAPRPLDDDAIDESVTTSQQNDDVPPWNTRVPEGMTDEQHKAIVRETEEFYRWKIQQASRER